jgi:aspartyl-tRNA(Asn)/glutamyl-tRNA(Gln) amidotransferase subunit B
MPVRLAPEQIEEWRNRLPELPRKRRERFVAEYGLPEYDAGVLVADKQIGDYFEAAARLSAKPKAVSNWVMTEMLRLLSEREMSINEVPLKPEALARLVQLADGKVVNSNTAKEIFAILFEKGGDPDRIVEEKGLSQVSDANELEALVEKAMAENPKSVQDFKSGKAAAAKFLVGQAMKLSRGKANPQLVAQVLEKRLG